MGLHCRVSAVDTQGTVGVDLAGAAAPGLMASKTRVDCFQTLGRESGSTEANCVSCLSMQ